MPRRFESQHKKQHAGGEHDIALRSRSRSDDRIGLIGDETVNHFRNLLDRTRIFDIQRNAYQHEKYQQQAEHQRAPWQMSRVMGACAIVGLDVHSVQNLCGQIPKVFV